MTVNENDKTKARRELKRRKTRSSKQKKSWLELNKDKVLLGAGFLLSAILLMNISPFAFPVQNSEASVFINLVNWFWFKDGSFILGVMGSLTCLYYLMVQIRHQVVNDPKMWQRVCPNCDETQTLKRTRRRTAERILVQLNVPAKRYICSNCHWEGVRIDERHISV